MNAEWLQKMLIENCPGLKLTYINFLITNFYSLKKKCHCPHCGRIHTAYNGTGPGEFEVLGMNLGPKLRFLLKFIPWDVWIQRSAVPYHDWMSCWGEDSGVTFEELNEVFRILVEADIDYYYKKKINKMWFPRRSYLKLLNFLLLDRVDEICEYFVGSDETRRIYEKDSCRKQ